ncbi:MAG: WYL domain-containing protein [Chlorobium sp.]|uniref:hypothetical protein n=1 Tax=Chlorobium sp. TaxID=1095 RepID=UPI001E0606BA|nr:hypothetical protein [Chlorobium sp.]MBN1279826.1 hypothetical protein [Chlorobiaceae bacterium]MCF8216150.1 WYL domain-containing protein [Chlorobium sp.]MCF8271112.1 WYL domain-containing protein [Chlorobium sp.]MCF8287426.1 WYL domain-containing protein [Chlorobium sp.]MCF8291025.1 WYL domain-containing protein [Chlorobium sp.]
MLSVLKRAIAEKKVVSVFFHGEGGYRLIEPFLVGTTDTGIEALRAFQVGGFSNTFKTYGWKLFRVDCITSIDITDETFSPSRPDYNPDDPVIRTVICRC